MTIVCTPENKENLCLDLCRSGTFQEAMTIVQIVNQMQDDKFSRTCQEIYRMLGIGRSLNGPSDPVTPLPWNAHHSINSEINGQRLFYCSNLMQTS